MRLSAIGCAVAHATLTVAYSVARCLTCNRWLMLVPGGESFEVRPAPPKDARAGRGIIVPCARCGRPHEVIGHGGDS